MKTKFKNTYTIQNRNIPIIELVWLDHVGSEGWQTYDPDRGDGKLAVCHSVGYLIDETLDTYILAQSYGQPPSMPWNGRHNVAKELVIKKKILFKRK